jgi:hypothetical protein
MIIGFTTAQHGTSPELEFAYAAAGFPTTLHGD